MGDNLIFWKRKKNKNVVVRSCVEIKYRTMTSFTCELIWLKWLLKWFQIWRGHSNLNDTHLYVTIKLLFMLAQIPSFVKGPYWD